MQGASYRSLMDFLRDDLGCTVYFGDDLEARITSWDDAHLTLTASDAVAKAVLVPKILSELN